MGLVGISLPILVTCVTMSTWRLGFIALLQHAAIVDLQDSQDGSHVIVRLPHFDVGVHTKKNFDLCGFALHHRVFDSHPPSNHCSEAIVICVPKIGA